MALRNKIQLGTVDETGFSVDKNEFMCQYGAFIQAESVVTDGEGI